MIGFPMCRTCLVEVAHMAGLSRLEEPHDYDCVVCGAAATLEGPPEAVGRAFGEYAGRLRAVLQLSKQ